jgi:hypothetical protein
MPSEWIFLLRASLLSKAVTVFHVAMFCKNRVPVSIHRYVRDIDLPAVGGSQLLGRRGTGGTLTDVSCFIVEIETGEKYNIPKSSVVRYWIFAIHKSF